jgi:hypothetical protein
LNVSKKDTLLKQRKNKTFNYKSRFSNQKDDLVENSQTSRFTSKWQRERDVNLVKSKRGFSLVTLILILVLLLICLYVLESKFM